MKKNTILRCIAILWIGFFCILPLQLKANSYNVGNYNIRVIWGDSEDKSSPKYWENRKEYVGKTVVDNDYDVIGFQEIGDETQESSLKSYIPNYTLITWGRDKAEVSSGERVGVAFKTSKFDMLDSGHFFLTPNIAVPGIAWDAGCARVSVWAKLQDKESKEVFFFLSTHLDNSGAVARREGARINADQMIKIAAGYPAIIVGDLNAKANSKQVHYTLGRYFNDSRLASNITIEGPEGTLCAWDPNYNADRRIDYIYTRRVDVKSYKTITNDYGRGTTPSDHFAIIATVSLQEPSLPGNIYVSDAAGNDSNDGTISAPFKSLYKALSTAQSCDTIRMTSGTYYTAPTESITRTSYLKVQNTTIIIGGYDSNFEKIIGYSRLDGDFNKNDVFDASGKVISGNEDNSRLLLCLYKPYEVTFKNFEFCNGYMDDATSTRASALYLAGYGLNLDNARFINNNSMALAGAIRSTSTLNLNNCSFLYNSGIKGGALYLDAGIWAMRATGCNFESNKADYGAAVFVIKSGDIYIYGNSFVNNIASKNGAMTFLGDADLKSTYTFVNNTFANNQLAFTGSDYSENVGGSALFFSTNADAHLSMVNNTIVGNDSRDANHDEKFRSAAVKVSAGYLSLYNNIIAGNFCTSGKGDIINDVEDVNRYIAKNNLYTSADNISIKTGATTILGDSYATGLASLAKALDGRVENDCFKANSADNGGDTFTVKVINPLFGSTPINYLTKRDLNEYFMNAVDLDGGLGTFTILAQDQRGTTRNWEGKSTLGAYEYIEGAGVESNMTDKAAIGKAVYSNGFIILANCGYSNFSIYNMQGVNVKSGITDTDMIDVRDLNTGFYIFKANNINCKFIK